MELVVDAILRAAARPLACWEWIGIPLRVLEYLAKRAGRAWPSGACIWGQEVYKTPNHNDWNPALGPAMEPD
jgi:hypothetical protein